MSNFDNNANLRVFRFPKGGTNLAGCIADIFDIDGDFKENEEYFRDDTTSIGYQSESQRCADEVFEKVKDLDGEEQIEAIVKEVFGYSFENEHGTVTFLIGNENYSGDNSYVITPTNDEFILSIAYVG
jgi:predicted 3-demethylubiquinone-9 3-methyltransferase (glyoxalase superfamily)